MKCCNKNMKVCKDRIHDMTVTDLFFFVCAECGSYFKVETGQIDKEDAENYKDYDEVTAKDIKEATDLIQDEFRGE